MTKFVQLAQNKRNLLTEKKGFSGWFRLSQEKLSVFLFFALLACSFGYLFLINNVSTGGFELKALEQKIALLKEENKKLDLEATKLQAMNTIAQASGPLELTQAESADYLEVTPPVVALSR